MQDIRALCFDIDGTLAMMDKETSTYTALPGAVEALAEARARGLPVVAYTNGTFFPPAHYYPLLADAGIEIAPGHVLTPAAVAAARLKDAGMSRVMVMGAEGTTVPVAEAGIEVVPATKAGLPVEAVLLGWTKDFGAAELEAVVQAVWDGAVPYAGSVAPFFAGANGRLLGISGAIAAALENATEVKVTVFGKPEVAGLEIASVLTGVAPEHFAVIGDDPKLEIRMGRRAGAYCVGVTTGIADEAAFASFPEGERAHIILPGLTGLFDRLGV